VWRTQLAVAAAILAVGCLAGGLLLLAVRAGLRRRTGIGAAHRVVAADVGATAARTAPSRRLRDPVLGLRGRPDYLLEAEERGRTVVRPMEVKPMRRSARLHDGDEEQLAAYLLGLRAEEPERFGGSGYVRYATRTFEVALTAELEERVRRRVARIRAQRLLPVVHRSHHQPGRCRACPVRHACDEALD
jgi:CRISPR-associated exonuclease Cas4